MNQPEICINSSDRSLYQNSTQNEQRKHEKTKREDRQIQARRTQDRQTQIRHQQAPFINTETNTEHSPEDSKLCPNMQLGELACSFTRIRRQGKPALLASVSVPVRAVNQESLPTLLHHAEELNLRLPFLKVSVRRGTGFVLHGLFCGNISSVNMSDLLDRLTQDFQIFLSYARAHDIQIQSAQKNIFTIA